MSLLGTLAKVAIGIAVAKGVGGMLKKSGGTGPAPTGSGDGGILGELGKLGKSSGRGGGIEDILGEVLGGKKDGSRSGSGGGLGDLLEQLGGGGRSSDDGSGGGLGDLIDGLTRGGGSGQSQGQRDGGLGDIFGDFLGGVKEDQKSEGSFGDIFNQSLERRGEPDVQPTRQQEAAAALMLRAMIQAAKSDGKFDQGEREKLLENLGEVSREEKQFVDREFERPVDANELAQQVPRGLEQQVYLMSVMGIDLDSRAEAQYLHDLAMQMDLGRDEVNGIHDHLGVPRIYS